MKSSDITPEMGIPEILRRAIADEEESHAFYLRAAELALLPDDRTLFLALAEEELDHRRRLEEILAAWLTREELNQALGG